jgi:hypothetical protein
VYHCFVRYSEAYRTKTTIHKKKQTFIYKRTNERENNLRFENATMARTDRPQRPANVAAAGKGERQTQRNEGSASDGAGTVATMVYATTATIRTSSAASTRSTGTRGQSRKIPERTRTIPEKAADSPT